MDAGTGQIVAATLTAKDADDASQVDPLLDQVAGPLASFTGDGAYDQDRVYASVAERHPTAAVVVPPRVTAVPSNTAKTAPTPRDRHVQHIAEHGRMAWQKTSGYTKRARIEATMGRWKQVIGDGRSRSRFRVRSTWNTSGGCARIRISGGRKPSRFHRPRRWNTAGGDRRGGRRPRAQLHAGAWTPDLRPHRPNPDGVGVNAPASPIHAPR